MKTTAFLLRTTPIVLFASLLSAGCAGKRPVSTRELPPGAIVLTEQEYEYVYVTGSNLPVLVPKNPSIRSAAQTASPVSTMSVEQFQDAINRSHAPSR